MPGRELLWATFGAQKGFPPHAQTRLISLAGLPGHARRRDAATGTVVDVRITGIYGPRRPASPYWQFAAATDRVLTLKDGGRTLKNRRTV